MKRGTGHTHTDSGHSHSQDEHDHSAWTYKYSSSGPLIDHGSKLGESAWNYTTDKAKPTIHSAKAQIQKSYTGIGNVEESHNPGGETRPKNMKVIFIMRIE